MTSFENSHVLQECVQKETTLDLIIDIKDQSQPSSADGTRSTPAMPHRLQNGCQGDPKWQTRSEMWSILRVLAATINFN